MSKAYKTARGKPVQMDKIKLANENTVAVGNMRTNARGDVLGAGNSVAVTRNAVMDQVYAVEEAPYSPNDTQTFVKQQTQVQTMATNAQQFNNLANNLTVPVTPQATADTTPAPAARGSLASSVADTTSVNQAAIPNPKTVAKSNGPTRI
jgi:hypothetical protein